MTHRAPRILASIAAILGCALLAVVVSNSTAWIGRTFPGFFLMSNRVVASVSLPDWFAVEPSALFQHEVVAVDGERVGLSEDVYARIGALAPGTRVTYALRSQSGAIHVETVPARVFTAVDWYLVFGAYLVNGISFLAIGLVVFWLRPRAAASRGLLSACLAAGVFAITGVDLYGPHWFFRAHVIGESMLGVGLLHLALVFPSNRLGNKPARALLGLYLPFVALAAVYQMVLDRPAAYTVVHLIANGALGVCGIPLIALVGYDLLTTRSPLVRRRTRFVVLGTAAGFAPPAILMAASGLFGGEIPVNAAGLTAPLFPLALGYAIVKQNLFEIDFMLRRALAYAAMIALVASLAAFAALHLPTLMPSRHELLRSPFVLVPLNLAILLALVLLRSHLRRVVDRIFFPEEYESGAALALFTQRLAWANDTDSVLRCLGQAFSETVLPKHAALFTPAGENTYRLRSAEPGAPDAIDVPGELHQRLLAGEMLSSYESDDGPSAPGLWRDLDAEILAVVRAGETPVALLVLGAKSSGRDYSMHDVAFLQTVAAQLAIALTKAQAFGDPLESTCRHASLSIL